MRTSKRDMYAAIEQIKIDMDQIQTTLERDGLQPGLDYDVTSGASQAVVQAAGPQDLYVMGNLSCVVDFDRDTAIALEGACAP